MTPTMRRGTQPDSDRHERGHILALSLVAALIYGVWRFSDSRYAPQSSRRRRGVRLFGVVAVIRAFIAWDILTRFQTPLVVRMPVGDWLPEPDSLASQLVVGVWLGSAIAFTTGYRVTESGIIASGDRVRRRGPGTHHSPRRGVERPQ